LTAEYHNEKSFDMIDLSGQTALVTGASRGIGAATALKLAAAGANVAITYANAVHSAESTLKAIKAYGVGGSRMKLLIQKYPDCKAVAEKVMRKFGRIDILVNNAGIWERGDILTMSPADWRKTLEINLFGVFNVTRAVAPIMKKQKYGRIINISSTAGQRGEAFHSAYAASKGGVIAFTKSIAIELIRSGIYVNCVAPGWVGTDMTSSVFRNQRMRRQVVKTIPRGVIPTPEEISGAVLYLASNLSNNVVGEVLSVNGGSVLNG
jgi:3-oxoacyl-[acyl-carrier protein] reductase